MKPTLLTLSVLAVAPSWLLLATESAPDAGSGAVEDPSHFRIAERGQDFAVYQRLTAMTNAEGLVCFRTNQFTLLENGLHWYDQAAGEWKESQDLIESFPEGAIARYGPVRAIFAHDLNAESVFDLETPEGVRLRGGVRALEWLNELTGERVLLATVNARAPLELVPPNRLVARDAFDGLRADVMLEWRRNRFSQSVVLLETPLLPEGWEADPVRLAVITEFIDAPEPEINRVQIVTDGALETEDHLSIGFGGVSILMGHAFATSEVEAEGGLLLGAMQADGATVSVRKNWRAVVGGGALLEESVGLIELARLLETLPKQARAERAASRAWRTARVESAVEARPVAVAYAPYQPKGVWVDFELNGSTNSYTFAMGQTYYIRTNFTVGPGTATFQPGCTVKLNTNAYVLVYGPVAFANTLQTPVFTSSRDDAFGEDIDGSPGSVPDYDAYAGLWVYYNDNGTIIQDARFRWAKTAVRYDGYPKTHYLGNSLLERCQTGVYVSSSIQLYTWGLEKHALQADFAGPGTNQVSGTMSQAPFYTDKSFAGLESNGRTVADTMGGIGSSEFLEVTTRAKIAVFNRTTGVRTEEQWLNQFFGVPEATDPRVWFDNASSTGPRWIVSAMYYAGKQALLKVSLTSSPSLASNWRSTYVINIPAAGDETIDFPTLGVDTNGIFLSVQKRNNLVNRGYSIQAFAKPTVYTDPNYGTNLPPVLSVPSGDLNAWCIQPAYNFEGSPVGGYTWFVAKGPSDGIQGGLIYYRRVRWNGANAEWVGTWQAASGAYRDYYDIPQGSSFPAPQTVGLGGTGSRLMMAVIRDGTLWTCHHVGLGSNGTYTGGTVDRSGVQVLKLQVSSSALTYSSKERIYDNGSNPYFYHFPSLNVNRPGDFVVGFSGSRTNEFIGAFFTGRRANGTWMTRPGLMQAGRAAYSGGGWGDYSATSCDPTDNSIWTAQMYADPDPDGLWRTWITEISVTQ